MQLHDGSPRYPFMSFNDNDPSFLTNFNKSDLPIYNFVSNLVGVTTINQNAYDCMGRSMPSCMSLHKRRSDLGDLGPFWRIFDWVKNYYNTNKKLPTRWDVFKAIQRGFAELRSMV